MLAPQVGLEPTTLRLTAECSAIELLRNKRPHIDKTMCRARKRFYNRRVSERQGRVLTTGRLLTEMRPIFQSLRHCCVCENISHCKNDAARLFPATCLRERYSWSAGPQHGLAKT